ncbi:hypothetical protein HOY80DRAFT_739091 [Tuber brumale]|nr:hypothetical protein HOY80DRAFT_747535 [Tuber brumale]KAG0632779.1 hypothetical protein HOY80DRAFT_739091 [Tuber brumale]
MLLGMPTLHILRICLSCSHIHRSLTACQSTHPSACPLVRSPFAILRPVDLPSHSPFRKRKWTQRLFTGNRLWFLCIAFRCGLLVRAEGLPETGVIPAVAAGVLGT